MVDAVRHEKAITEHHSVVQELLTRLRGENSALTQAHDRAAAAETEAAEATQKHDEALAYLEQMTQLVRSELENLK